MEQLARILWHAATCLCSCGKVHAAYVYKLEENLESLERKWDHLHNMGIDMQRRIDGAEGMGEMQRTNEVNGWLQKVQHLEKEMEDIQFQGSQEIRNKCISGRCPKNCVSSYKLGKKVAKMLNDVDELVTLGKRFDKNVDITYKPPFKLVDEMPPVETVGLDLMLNQVWNSLEDENVGIIGLYGMGGAGKTTLLKKINNEFGKRKQDFAVVLWVVVSRDCDINKIMNDIRNRLGVNDDIWNQSSPDQRVAKIYQVLKQKKFVLMLDDLCEKLELEKVGVPLPKDTNNQSKILLTTRCEDVCAKMQDQIKFKMECLLEKEAFDLFCRKVGEETLKCHGEIPTLAWEIAKECKGLPLALITVGSAMAGVNSVEAWRQAKSDLRSSAWTASNLEEKVFSILKFSYDRLPDETHKSCFLYCALYPEDYAVTFDDLLDRWIGEGFLGKDKTKSIYDTYEQGESIVEKLKLSCLLEDADDTSFDRRAAIKMHDVIRDMALWLARDQDRNKDKVLVQGEALATSQMDSERLNVVERISITNFSGTWQVPTCLNLFSLGVRGFSIITDFSILQSMRRLKVLDISYNLDIDHLPTEICKLISLEFLNLSKTRILHELPIDFKNLKNLRVFLMENVNHDLEIIPLEVITSLERLKVFRFCKLLHVDSKQALDLSREVAFLEKLESLPELEELCIRLSTMTGMKKLLESNKLRGCLRHLIVSKFRDTLEISSLLASLSRMKHLDHISLLDVHVIMEGSSITDISHLSKLRWVRIGNCDSITHLTWLRYAPLVEFLGVYFCESIEEVVKGPEDEDEDSGTDRYNYNEIFSNLRRLHLYSLPKLKSIHKRALAFPSLKYIHIEDCPNLRKLPFNSNSTKDSLIKIEGSIDWWNDLEWEDTTIKDGLQSKFRTL